MYQVSLTQNANQDLEDIAEYISLDNPYRAISFVQELIEYAIHTLSHYPATGTKHRHSYRKAYKRYLIFYDIVEQDKRVVITHIKNPAQYTAYYQL